MLNRPGRGTPVPRRRTKMFRFLLEHGAKPGLAGYQYHTPLLVVSNVGDLSTVSKLVYNYALYLKGQLTP